MREIVNFQNIESAIQECIANKIDDAIYHIHKQPLVFASKSNDVNYEYCQSHNIDVISSFNMGGTIVSNTGDIDMAIFKQDGWDVGRTLLTKIYEWLANKNINAKVMGNDIIVDEKYKVVSFASINTGDKFIYTCVHISFNPNVELIGNICSKEMIKVPKALTEYGITQQQIIDFIKEVLTNANNI